MSVGFLLGEISEVTQKDSEEMLRGTTEMACPLMEEQNHQTLVDKVTMYLTVITTDMDRSGTSAHGENWTWDPHSSLSHHENHDEEETQHPTSTSKKDGGRQFWFRRVSEVKLGRLSGRHWLHLLFPRVISFMPRAWKAAKYAYSFFKNGKKNDHVSGCPKGQSV